MIASANIQVNWICFTVDRQPSGGRMWSTLLSNEKLSKFYGRSSIDTTLIFPLYKYYQLREVKNNLGDALRLISLLFQWHLFRDKKWPNLASWKMGLTDATSSRFNCRYLKMLNLSRFRIYVMKNSKVSPISMQKCSEIASGDKFRSKILEGVRLRMRQV